MDPDREEEFDNKENFIILLCMVYFNVSTVIQVDELDTEVENDSPWLNTQRSSCRESLLGSSDITRLRNGHSGCYLTVYQKTDRYLFVQCEPCGV